MSACYKRRGITRTFYNFPSSSFLEELSLCEHSFLTLSFANDDFHHGRGSQCEIVIRSYTAPSVSRLRLVPHVAVKRHDDKNARVASGQQCNYFGFFFCPL